MKKRYIPLSIILLLLGSALAGSEMGMFDFMKIYLFSEVGGEVTMDGKPVAGVEVIRTTKSDDKNITDKTNTDKQGRFHFKAIAYPSLKKIYWDPTIMQKINFRYKGKEYLGWEHFKMNLDNNGETEDNTVIAHLKCDLSKKPTQKDQQVKGPISGVCDW